MTVDWSERPSLVAVTIAVPGATAVTTPLADTVATAGLLEVQTTGRSVSVAPEASFTVAESVVVVPAISDTVAGATFTDATGTGETITVAVPVLPSETA